MPLKFEEVIQSIAAGDSEGFERMITAQVKDFIDELFCAIRTNPYPSKDNLPEKFKPLLSLVLGYKTSTNRGLLHPDFVKAIIIFARQCYMETAGITTRDESEFRSVIENELLILDAQIRPHRFTILDFIIIHANSKLMLIFLQVFPQILPQSRQLISELQCVSKGKVFKTEGLVPGANKYLNSMGLGVSDIHLGGAKKLRILALQITVMSVLKQAVLDGVLESTMKLEDADTATTVSKNASSGYQGDDVATVVSGSTRLGDQEAEEGSTVRRTSSAPGGGHPGESAVKRTSSAPEGRGRPVESAKGTPSILEDVTLFGAVPYSPVPSPPRRTRNPVHSPDGTVVDLSRGNQDGDGRRFHRRFHCKCI